MVFFPWENIVWYDKTKYENILSNDAKSTEEDEIWKITMNDSQTHLNGLREKITKYDDMRNLNEIVNAISSNEIAAWQNDYKWEYFKKIVNPFELIYTQAKYNLFPQSVALINPLSRSYFKMIEMLRITDFFKSFSGKRIRSGHVCEGPGGFIEAFIDECGKNHITATSSVAMTLKSTHNSVPGWKKANTFLKKHGKTVKIIYGQDDTGDILNKSNQADFINQTRENGGLVNIFTGDGGFDFSMNYDIHEKLIYPLIESSVVIGMNVLAPRGMIIIKFFDIYTEPMKRILYYLSKNFGRWTLFKPATSRPCNSEIYFIGQDRVPASMLLLPTPENMTQDISMSFRALIDNKIQDIVLSQIQYLEKVFSLIEMTDRDEKNKMIQKMLDDHLVYSFIWCNRFNIEVDLRRFRLIEASRTYQQVVFQQ